MTGISIVFLFLSSCGDGSVSRGQWCVIASYFMWRTWQRVAESLSLMSRVLACPTALEQLLASSLVWAPVCTSCVPCTGA